MEHPTTNDGADAGKHSVFLSYSRTDQKKALLVVRALEQAGFSVWWDGLLEGGERFAHITEAALENARAVVVLWSKTSITSHWVHDEATQGRDSKRLVPVSLDGSKAPLGFRQFQCIDISRNISKPQSEEMHKMLRAVDALHDNQHISETISHYRGPWLERRGILIGGASIVLGGSAIAAWQTGIFSRDSPPGSIAVLPFANLSGDPEQGYFSDGLTSEIRSQLSRNPLMEIIGQTSSNEFRNHTEGAQAIAKILGVTWLLDGNVQKSGDRIKITTDLSDGRNGSSKWSESYERPLADIFAMQGEIAAAVTTALSIVIDDKSEAKQIGGTQSIAAFDTYLRGKDLYEAGIDENSDRTALAKFDEAIAIDPQYAAAHAARSRALAVIGNLYGNYDERVRMYAEAVTAARMASEIAPEFAEGHSALGFALSSGKLDMRAARTPYERSYQLGRGDADTLSRYAIFTSRLGNYTLAKQVIERSSRLDPLNARTFRSLGDINYLGRKYQQAISAYTKAIELNRTMSGFYSLLGFAQFMLGDLDGAESSFAKEKSGLRRLPGLSIIAQKKGNPVAAQAALDGLITEYGDKSHYQYAQIYAQWGDKAKAVSALKAAWQFRDGGLLQLYSDPLLDPIRKTTEFSELAKRIGFI